jgi:Fic family protein
MEELLPATESLPRLLGNLDELKGRWPLLTRLPPERLSFHRRMTFLRNIVASCRLEGIDLELHQLEDVLSREGGVHELANDVERIAAGSSRALLDASSASRRGDRLSSDTVKGLHHQILRYSPDHELHRGEYRWEAVETGPGGDQLATRLSGAAEALGLAFEGASPSRIPVLMEELSASTAGQLTAGPMHPVVATAAFAAAFASIQPFRAANGLLLRMLSQTLLLSVGYEQLLYHPLDEVLEKHRTTHDELLVSAAQVERTDHGIAGPSTSPAAAEWTLFFTQCLVEQGTKATAKMRREALLAPLPPLSESILEIAREHGRATVGGVVRITGANRNTVKVHFRRLCAQGLLEMRGAGRGAWYAPSRIDVEGEDPAIDLE